jgi:hypothetical protein
VGSWLRGAWALWERLLYSAVAMAALAYALLLAYEGNLSPLV